MPIVLAIVLASMPYTQATSKPRGVLTPEMLHCFATRSRVHRQTEPVSLAVATDTRDSVESVDRKAVRLYCRVALHLGLAHSST